MDAQTLLSEVNKKTMDRLGEAVLEEIEIRPNGKVKVYFTNGNVKWFINFFQCFHSLNYQYNLKLVPANTSFAKLKEEKTPQFDSARLSTLKVRLVNEVEVIFDRYRIEKLKYFKNTVYKEIKQVIYDDEDVLRLSKKEFGALKKHLLHELYEKYGKNPYIVDIVDKLKKLEYDSLYS
jgi:hypothetical protein